jgi:diguanylate cyclase (GGDEF)-like protein
MHVDNYTVLLFGLFIKLVLGGLFATFWLKNRDSPWFAWWGAGLACASATTAIFMLRGPTENFLALAIGTSMLIGSVVCCWQGARTFENRRPLWLGALIAPSIWLAACLVPGFLDSVRRRMVLSSLLLAGMALLAGFEFWRGRRESLPSRWGMIFTCASLSLFFASRIPLMEVLPFPFGALPMRPGWIGAFNLILLSHTLLLIVLMVALSKERLELEQRTKAQTDPLTGALNRRAFMASGERLLARHHHEGATLSLLFLDVDHFKSMNDRFGHSGGDDVLTRFVDLVNACIRPTDFLFRIGGEEFCCLLPHTDPEQAQRVAERIRRQVETTPVIVAGVPVKATVSIGIACTDEFGYDLDALIRRADKAVYSAKRAGRNRVMVASSAEADELAAPIAMAAGRAFGA